MALESPPPLVAHRGIQMASLLTLTIQNSMLAILLRYSQTAPTKYFSTTAVLMCELIKASISYLIYYRSAANANVFKDIFSDKWYFLAVPAILYTIQNNLQFIAASALDAATFQVTYQLKILTTALCSVWLLHRSLSFQKWGALVILTCGVILVQFPSPSAHTEVHGPSVAEHPAEEKYHKVDDLGSLKLFGLVCIISACITSGLAGVYFEKILKESHTSLWIRNMQLSLFSIIPALFGILVKDGRAIADHGFWYGYTQWTWAAIWCQALGGLIVAVVVKHCDNILKGFATSISIILSSIVSVYLFQFEISFSFCLGAFLVIAATFIYGLPERRKGYSVL
jgi:UDP-sugar transporter A1/2/3